MTTTQREDLFATLHDLQKTLFRTRVELFTASERLSAVVTSPQGREAVLQDVRDTLRRLHEELTGRERLLAQTRARLSNLHRGDLS